MPNQNNSILLWYTLVYIFILIGNTESNAQNKVLKGRIITQKGLSLDATTIITPNGKGTVSRPDGTFILYFNDAKEKQQLNIRRLGYQTIDTLITLDQEDTTRIELVLQEKIYQQNLIEISAERLNIFQRNNWVVLDYAILNDQFIFLYKQKRKRKLGLFDSNGFLIHEQSIIEPYKDIKLSCTQTILVNGKWESAEYHILNKQLSFIKYHSQKEYERTLKPCIARINEEFFFKDFANHNKVVNYYTFPSPRKPELITSISDTIAAQVAASYYQDILIAYTNAVRRNYSQFRRNHRDILPGDDISQLHLINDGLWNGDLKKLMVDPITLDLVPQYLLLESKPIQTAEFIRDDSLYIVDFLNKRMISINCADKKYIVAQLNNFNWKGTNTIVTDQKDGINYLINKDKFENYTLFQIVVNSNKGHYLKKLNKLNIEGDKQSRVLINEKRLYYLAKYTRKNTRFKWIELQE